MSEQVSKSPKIRGSAKARRTAGRLFAVQAIYQMKANRQNAGDVIDEYLMYRTDMELEGENDGESLIVSPDGALFRSIVLGVESQHGNLKELVNAHLTRHAYDDLENILQAILVGAAFELLNHTETDAPIIIADYLHVTRGYYGDKEAGFVNAVADSISAAVRF